MHSYHRERNHHDLHHHRPGNRVRLLPLDGLDAFFFELRDEESARAWFENGGLEVGATDRVYIEGPVVMLARTPQQDAAFSTHFERSARP